ncbi:MAG: serine/threonine protein kinase [Deltaproteobacteria bacterium]|nr:serine/threonine protein kinase [Deltaproteobacteria bacterium]
MRGVKLGLAAGDGTWSPDGQSIVYTVFVQADSCDHIERVTWSGSAWSAPELLRNCLQTGEFIANLAWITIPWPELSVRRSRYHRRMGGDTGDSERLTRETSATIDDVGRVGPPSPRPPSASRYQLGEVLGRGGMGEVVVARDEQIGRDVAIKRILASEPSERSVTRFLREAQIQGRLEHPAIPPVHELGRDPRGLPYFVMKKLVGTTISAILSGERAAVHTRQRLLRAFAEVCLAIEFAHVHGVIHRDLKPSNIMLGAFGEVYVLDWGVAKVVGESDAFDDLVGEGTATRIGAVIGTPGYMAPEQARGVLDIDARVDVYALGVVLGELLAADPDPTPELDELRERAIAADRDDRVPTARILADAVHAYLEGDRDLALRQARARDHLARARAAMTDRDSEGARKVAMNEAGRAVALDPAQREAGELIASLMLTPSPVPPREVVEEIARGHVQWFRAFVRAILLSICGYMVFLPLVVSSSTPLVLFAINIVMMAVIAIMTARGHLLPLHVYSATAGVQVGLLTMLFSPIITAGPAVVIVMQMGLNPRIGRRDTFVLGGALLAGLFVPVLAGELGWTARLMVVTSHGIELSLPYGMTQTEMLTFTIAGLCILIGVALSLASAIRTTQGTATTQLRVQSWHLRQLLSQTTG